MTRTAVGCERLIIAVLTRGREAALRRCLASLLGARPPAGIAVQVLVVDNNDTALTSIGDAWPCDTGNPRVKVVREPRCGVGHARARAIASSADYDWLMFFDDDQTATADMLEQLFAVQRAFDASVVSGVVLPRFSSTAGGRIPRSFFERERRPTGTIIPAAGAGCLLVRRRLLGEDVCALLRDFNDGGEDTAMTLHLSALGHSVVWADNAVAYEDLDDARLRWTWVFRRATKHGRTLARYQSHYGAVSRLQLVLGGLGRLLSAAAASLLPRRSHRTRLLTRALRGVGYLQVAFKSLKEADRGSDGK